MRIKPWSDKNSCNAATLAGLVTALPRWRVSYSVGNDSRWDISIKRFEVLDISTGVRTELRSLSDNAFRRLLVINRLHQDSTRTAFQREENNCHGGVDGAMSTGAETTLTRAIDSGKDCSLGGFRCAGQCAGGKYSHGGQCHHSSQLTIWLGVRLRLAWSAGLSEDGTYLHVCGMSEPTQYDCTVRPAIPFSFRGGQVFANGL